ncbi:MAG: glycosyltransferase family 2 protein [Nitrososphaerota archaeon]|nr:glycosyltransferase family 2 protein [Nitrososphaerota archaeon]
MGELPKVSAIVLNHNSLKKLGREVFEYVRSIVETDYPNLQVIFVDNASVDGSERAIAEAFGQVRLLKLEENRGYAGGNNAGARTASRDSKYLAFLNNDLIVERSWLRRVVEVMERDGTIGAAQPKIMQLKNPKLIDSMGGAIDRTGRAYDVGHGLPETRAWNRLIEVFYARGAAIVVRRDLFELAGGFDEDYFIYYEETDLCWRIRLLGYRVVTVPDAVVYHLGGGTTGKPNEEILFHRRKNQLMTLLKNYSTSNLARYGTQLILLYSIYSLLKLLQGDVSVSRSLAKALLWNAANLRRTAEKRARVQSIRRVGDGELMRLIWTRREFDKATSYLPRTY